MNEKNGTRSIFLLFARYPMIVSDVKSIIIIVLERSLSQNRVYTFALAINKTFPLVVVSDLVLALAPTHVGQPNITWTPHMTQQQFHVTKTQTPTLWKAVHVCMYGKAFISFCFLWLHKGSLISLGTSFVWICCFLLQILRYSFIPEMKLKLAREKLGFTYKW